MNWPFLPLTKTYGGERGPQPGSNKEGKESGETERESRKQKCVLYTRSLPTLVLTEGLSPVSERHGLCILETINSFKSLLGKALAESILVIDWGMAYLTN